jgi:phosphate-selective porin OprO/OprP
VQLKHWIVTAVVLSAYGTGQQVRADDTADSIKALQKQIGDLDQKVKTLERKRELDQEASTEAAKNRPVILAGPTGLGFRSADTNFVIKLRGVLQTDSRTFFNDHGIVGNDGFLLRRARPSLEGTVYRDFDFLFVPDLAGSSVQIFDAYLNYRHRPEWQLRLGKFKTPVGLEQLQADRDLTFNERGLATSLVPNRDVGAQLHGEVFSGGVTYAAGIFNGVGDFRNTANLDFEDDKEFAGRLFLQPWKSSGIRPLQGLGFGVGGSYGNEHTAAALPSTTGGTLPGYVTDGQQQFFAYNPAAVLGTSPVVVANGRHWRLAPQGYYYWGPLGLLGEYVLSNQRVSRTVVAPLTTQNLEHEAWQITGSWVLTGEDASYTGVTPFHPFDPRTGGWGAWQLIGRYGSLDIDNQAFPNFANPATSATKATAWSAGLSWYLNKNVRVSASFSHTTFAGAGAASATAPGNVSRQPENVLFTRVQLAF